MSLLGANFRVAHQGRMLTMLVVWGCGPYYLCVSREEDAVLLGSRPSQLVERYSAQDVRLAVETGFCELAPVPADESATTLLRELEDQWRAA